MDDAPGPARDADRLPGQFRGPAGPDLRPGAFQLVAVGWRDWIGLLQAEAAGRPAGPFIESLSDFGAYGCFFSASAHRVKVSNPWTTHHMDEQSHEPDLESKMKNPWMSAWLSAANSMAAPARGAIMAEMQKTQTQLIKTWQRAWVDAWMEMWFPGSKRR